ncbi:malonyl-ACP O-methyltransferase BioC [Aliamphritea hakodatensis]|uniref:malonyl-ACP O-methyltransferase BioC n=1 Tax=Aliamphritea hakodatensis TaxID=2895352 RepID=UPI0022FDB05C|nr:malonyl-ACP O-methyltransferase BioC [Aliamphritea hakodatensis]
MSQFSKQEVATSFSRAASSYDNYAKLQQQVGEQLLATVSAGTGQQVRQAVDLGCGTGYFIPRLMDSFQPECLTGIDLAPGMLSYAREHHAGENIRWVCGDAEALPLAADSVDLIFSSLAIQWCENLPRLFAEVYRVLRPGGQFVFSTLGPESLCELRASWATVDRYQHVSEFTPLSQLRSSIGGLEEVSFDVVPVQLLYRELRGLTNELKRIGAHNMSAGRPEGLTGKRHLLAFRDAYEAYRRDDGLLPATYEVAYVVLRKPE